MSFTLLIIDVEIFEFNVFFEENLRQAEKKYLAETNMT